MNRKQAKLMARTLAADLIDSGLADQYVAYRLEKDGDENAEAIEKVTNELKAIMQNLKTPRIRRTFR